MLIVRYLTNYTRLGYSYDQCNVNGKLENYKEVMKIISKLRQFIENVRIRRYHGKNNAV